MLDSRLATASLAYKPSCTCSQAVFCAYAAELEIEQTVAYRLMEGFGGGCGGLNEWATAHNQVTQRQKAVHHENP